MPTLALPRLSSIPEFEETSFQPSYPLRRSPSYFSLSTTTALDDISPGRSHVCITFHLLQPDGVVDRTTQYEVDRLGKWSHLIGDIERTVATMGGFHILKIHCEDGKDVRRAIRRGELVWQHCERIRNGRHQKEYVNLEVVLSATYT